MSAEERYLQYIAQLERPDYLPESEKDVGAARAIDLKSVNNVLGRRRTDLYSGEVFCRVNMSTSLTEVESAQTRYALAIY